MNRIASYGFIKDVDFTSFDKIVKQGYGASVFMALLEMRTIQFLIFIKTPKVGRNIQKL